MKKYIKIIDGIQEVKVRNKIAITKNGKVIYNPTKEMLLDDGWMEYIEPEPSEEQLIERAKQRKLNELRDYDESNDVNDCVIVYQGQELHYWANKTERDALKGALRDCIAMGRDTYRLDLRDKGLSISLPCEALLQILSALEIYAIDCYNRTTDHEFFIKALTTKDEIEAYDFTIGYTSSPRFEL